MHETDATIRVSRPRQQRLGRGMAQPLDLIVDRAVLFDVGVGRGHVRFGLVVVEVRDEVLDRVFGKNSRNSAHSWAASVLLWQSTSVGFCTSSMVRAMAIVLPLPVTPSSVCTRSPRRTPSARLLGGLRLIAGQRKRRDKLELWAIASLQTTGRERSLQSKRSHLALPGREAQGPRVNSSHQLLLAPGRTAP